MKRKKRAKRIRDIIGMSEATIRSRRSNRANAPKQKVVKKKNKKFHNKQQK